MTTEHLSHDPQFREAIRLFDAEEFFTCHDVLEEIWSETLDGDRQFLQGLIHAAVSLFHFGEGNLGGARKMCDSTLKYLSPYQPTHADINVHGFLKSYRECFQQLLAIPSGYPAHVTLNQEQLPKLGEYLQIAPLPEQAD